jgi:hypothetical protein
MPWAVGLVTLIVFWRDRGVLSYALRHPRAFTAASAGEILAESALPLAAAFFFCLVCWGLGRRLLGRMLQGEAEGSPLAGCHAFALGLGVVASLSFWVGLAGGLVPIGLAALCAAAVLAAAPECLVLLRRLPSLGVGRPTISPWLILPVVALGLVAFNALVTALAPPVAWDVLAYHLALPKLYLRWGRIEEIPWMIHSHWPHLMEALYALPLAWGGETTAALLHGAACAALAAALWRVARAEMGDAAAWVTVALWASQTSLLVLAGTAHSDGAVALFIFLSTAAVIDWKRTSRGGWLLLGGLLAGFAASSKLHGAVHLASLAAWVGLQRHQGRRCLREAAVVLGLGLAVVGPWYLKTWIGSGNPVWPFFSAWLGGKGGAGYIEGLYINSSRWSFPIDPALLWRFGPQFLIGCLTVLFLLARRGLPAWPRLGLALAVPYVILVVRQQDFWRFFLPYTPFLCLVAGFWATRVQAGLRRLAVVAAVGWGVIPAFTLSENNALFAVAGLRSERQPLKAPRELYLERSLDHYRLMRAADSLLPLESRVLLFQEIRGYYLDRDYRWGDPLNQGILRYGEFHDAGQLRARLDELGITHVLVNRGLPMYGPRPGYYEPRTLILMQEVLKASRLILQDGSVALYGFP